MNFSDIPSYVADFLNYMITIKNKSPNTIKEYYYDLRTFLRYLKAKDLNMLSQIEKIEDLENIDVSNFEIEKLKTLTLSNLYEYFSFLATRFNNGPYARARKVASIRSFFKYLYSKAKLIPDNPAKDLESPKLGKRNPRYLTLNESKKLLSAIDGENKERDFAIITLFLNCGLRLSELVNINLSDIKDDMLRIVGKGNKERIIYLNKACKDAIENYLKVRPTEGVKDKDALFLSERKKRISRRTVQYIVEKYVKMAGINQKKISAHKLRHTAATLMYRHGKVDIRSLQTILGHQSISTTEIYTHVNDDDIKKAFEKNPLSGENHDVFDSW